LLRGIALEYSSAEVRKVFENLAVSKWDGKASPLRIVRLPASAPQQAKTALAGGLVEDPGFAPHSF